MEKSPITVLENVNVILKGNIILQYHRKVKIKTALTQILILKINEDVYKLCGKGTCTAIKFCLFMGKKHKLFLKGEVGWGKGDH